MNVREVDTGTKNGNERVIDGCTTDKNNSNNVNGKLQSSSIKFYDFSLEVGETRFACDVIKMPDSLYVWIGNTSDRKMNDLSFALKINDETVPVTTQIIGSISDSNSTNFAKRLTKKCGMPTYVSFNLVVDNLTLLGIERSFNNELKQHPYILLP